MKGMSEREILEKAARNLRGEIADHQQEIDELEEKLVEIEEELLELDEPDEAA